MAFSALPELSASASSSLLDSHPWFEVAWLAASDRSSGKPYGDAVRWKLDTPLPERIARPAGLAGRAGQRAAKSSSPRSTPTSRASWSRCLPRPAAPSSPTPAPSACRKTCRWLFRKSTPSTWPDSEEQIWRKQSGGYIVTNPNCSAIGLVLALKPLAERFGIDSIFVSTMQAISGAGYPGVPSLDILGNVVPFIKNEEEKMEAETLRCSARSTAKSCSPLAAKMSAHCNRVAVEDGHTESVCIKLAQGHARTDSGGVARVQAARRAATSHGASAAGRIYAAGRPPAAAARQHARQGMAATVGRLRPCTLLDWKFTVLSHNTIRGAAGAALLNAELLVIAGKTRRQPRWPCRHEQAR